MKEGFISWLQNKEIRIWVEKKAIYMEIPYGFRLCNRKKKSAVAFFLLFSTNKNLFQKKKGYFFVIYYFCQSRLILHVQEEGNILLPAFQVVLTLQPAALLIICSEEKRQIRPTSWTEGLLMRASSSQLFFCLSKSSCVIITLKTERRKTQGWTLFKNARSILTNSKQPSLEWLPYQVSH